MGSTPRPNPDAIVLGQVLLGKYRVDDVLGQGGMGIVAKCTHLQLNEPVAIKMLRQDVMLDRDATERFQREAQAAHKLKSEHVAKVVDVGRFPENDIPYMVMEFLDGHDLGDLLEERGPLQAPFAAMLMLQAAEALAEAHSIGIVHRDVKPSNLFVTWRPDGSALIKVLDFGISKSPMGTDLKLTQTQSLLGTPAYMSPEQMRSARLVDSRTDIWSLGTVFYELLEGRRPFEAESFSEMCVKVAVDAPEPMVNTPPGLQQIILRCLAKNPDQRYATMAELGRDLLPHVQDVHQASSLVERMHRMASRTTRSSNASGDQWEGPSSSTGVRNTPMPMPIRDVASAPVAVPWHGGSDPVGQPVPTPSPFTPQPGAPDQTMREESKPARAMSEAYAVAQPKSKKWMAFVAVFIVAAVIGGVIFGMKAGGDDDTNRVTAPVDPAAEKRVDVKASDPKPSPAGSGDVNAVAPDPVAKEGSGSAKAPDEIEMKPDDPTNVAVKPNNTTKPPIVGGGRPNPNRNNPNRNKPPVVQTHKDPGKGSAETGAGSAKTVPKVEDPPAVPAVKKCSITERLPSGAWPAHCPQAKSQ